MKLKKCIAESFLEQSRGALDYYHRLFEKEQRKTFDQLYLVGWDPLIELPVFEKEGNLQRNPALLPGYLLRFTFLYVKFSR